MKNKNINNLSEEKVKKIFNQRILEEQKNQSYESISKNLFNYFNYKKTYKKFNFLVFKVFNHNNDFFIYN